MSNGTMDQMKPLSAYASNVASQFGEDGVLKEVFTRIDAANKWCVEFGALNGTHHSNVWNLITNEGWSGVLIEADPTYYEKLVDTHKENEHVTPLNRFVSFEGPDRLDAIFAKTALPKDFDFLSIDIDGNDYHVWEAMTEYQPRVVVVEFNPSFTNDVSFVQPRDMSVQQGSSLKALTELAVSKGYTLAAVTGVNGFFVRNDAFSKLGTEAPTIDEVNTDPQYFTRLFQLYDGTILIDGCDRMLWHGMNMDPKKMQMVRRPRYIAGISARPWVRALKYRVRRLPLYGLLQGIKQTIRKQTKA